MTVHNYPIPKAHANVNTEMLHPEVARRVYHLTQLLPGVTVISGVRTFQQQAWLYDKYRRGKGNLAANPRRVWNNGKGPGKGSRHQAQEPLNVGYAVDLRRGPYEWNLVEATAKKCGLWRSVASEPWHYIANTRKSLTEFIAAPALDGAEPAPEVRFDPIAKLAEISRSKLLRCGDRGLSVKFLQSLLAQLGWIPTYAIDGVFGRGTLRAVKRVQTACALATDGIVGPYTWHALLEKNPEAPVSMIKGWELKGVWRD